MIIGLSILLFALLITLWVWTMYASYKIESGVNNDKVSLSPFYTTIDRSVRLGRRGYYASMMYLRKGASWGNKKVTDGFIKIVPSSREAFEEKDQLTGLHAGPMSFFLQSISESRKKSLKHLSSAKKMI